MKDLIAYAAPSTSKLPKKHTHYSDLTSWASAAVDAGHIVGPDMGPSGGYIARNNDNHIVGRYSFSQGSISLPGTTSQAVVEDMGGGGISAGAVSGGPTTHSDFAPIIGPKLKLLRKARRKKTV